MTRMSSWTEVSPCQAGVAAALRYAFVLPADETARRFEELLHRIS